MDSKKLTLWEMQVWSALEGELERGVIDLDLSNPLENKMFKNMVVRVARSIYESQMEAMGYGKRK